MDKVELFSIPGITFYNPPEFREYLVENYDSSQVDHDLTIIVGITKHNKIDFFEALHSFGFTTVRNLGSVFHIRFELDEVPLEWLLRQTQQLKPHQNQVPIKAFR